MKKKKIKKILIILGSVLLFILLLAAIASLLFIYDKPLVKGIVEKQFEKRTGIHIVIGSLDYELFPLRIEAGAIEFTTLMDETEIDVFIEKLVLEGDFHRIRKKTKPYFDSVEAEGVRIISNIKGARKKIAIEDILRGLGSGMSYVRKIGLQNSSAEFNFPSQKLVLQGADIALVPSKAQDSFSYSLFFRDAEGTGQPQTNRFRNTIQGSGILSIKDRPAMEGRFILTSNRLAYGGKEQFFDEIRLNVEGEFHSDKNEFIFPSLEIEIPSFLNLAGPLAIVTQDELTLFFRPILRIDDLYRLFSLAEDRLPQQFDGLEIDGSALFEGEARITPARPGQKASVSGNLTLNSSFIHYRIPEYRFESLVSGKFNIDRFPDNQNISGRLKIDKSAFAGKDLEASGIKTDIPFIYDHTGSRIDIPSLKTSASTLSFNTPDRTFKAESAGFSGQVIIDLKKRMFEISKANLELDPFPPFDVHAQARLSPQNSLSFAVSAQSSRIDFKTLKDFFSFAIPQTIIDWEPDGWMNIHIKAQNSFREKQKIWEVAAEVEASDVQFHDPSFTIAGEALHPKLRLEGTFDQTFDDISFETKMELSQGESLWKDFYVDWKNMPLLGKISGRLHVPQRQLSNLFLEAAVPGLGRITAGGRFDLQDSPSADLEVTASALELASLLSFISQKGAVNQNAVKLKGEAESQIDAKIDKNALSLVGFIKIKDASWIDAEANFEMQGIEALIPFHFAKNTSSAKDEITHTEKGYLTFRKIRSSYLDLPPLRFDISSRKNGYTIQPFELDIFGQKAYVGETSIEYGSYPTHFKAQTSFSWRDGDLSKLPFLSQDFQLEGKLSMDLPVVKISPNQVLTEGQGKANVFGGDIAIENIYVHQPFSKGRTISCDVNLAGLDLEKITDSIPFGRVTGVINGEIKDLALSYGQPESFAIRIESEKRKGVPQRFSLKATNDLAILGTGEKTPFTTQSGWTKFVKEFRYKKIGMACSLKNDTFSLSGTIHKKGVEYLVKGSGLFAINVVNKQTQNQIQFKDMLNRIKRIGQSK